MTRALLLVALGAVIGYTVGFRDARQNDRTVIERVLDRAGASARGKYDPNVDRQIDAVDAETPRS